MPMPRTELLTKHCVVCEQPFLVRPPGQTSRFCRTPHDALYCSRQCRHKARFRRGTDCNELTVAQAAYIAGFLDGEGSIMLYMRRDAVALRVSFSNTKVDSLNWIQVATDIGNITVKERQNGKHAASYALLINSQSAYSCLLYTSPSPRD